MQLSIQASLLNVGNLPLSNSPAATSAVITRANIILLPTRRP